jgi:hypothetical protein
MLLANVSVHQLQQRTHQYGKIANLFIYIFTLICRSDVSNDSIRPIRHSFSASRVINAAYAADQQACIATANGENTKNRRCEPGNIQSGR